MRRRRFEECTWKRGEAFSEYFHKKMILANHVPVDSDEVMDYLIHGIPDVSLRDQARIQRFQTTTALLEAFEKIILREKGASRERTDDGAVARSGGKGRFIRAGETEHKNAAKGDAVKKRCHSCGSATHLAADCPTKNKGMKCFECREYGHIASQCPKK